MVPADEPLPDDRASGARDAPKQDFLVRPEREVQVAEADHPLRIRIEALALDDHVAVIGSSNMDLRSFALNYEIIVMLIGGDAVAHLRAIEDANRAVCRPSRWRSGASARPVRSTSTRSCA